MLPRFVSRLFRRLFSQNASMPVDPNDPLTRLTLKIPDFEKKLSSIKSNAVFSDKSHFWYPYGTLANFSEIESTLTGANRDIISLIADLPVADIGAADGDIAFFLEHCGVKNVHIIDHAPTNCNRLEGARLLKHRLSSSVEVHDMNIDSEFTLPLEEWGLVFLLGTLYHLRSPYYVLERLSRHTRYCMLSTRITRYLPDKKTDLSKAPVAYLLGERECNNDNTNYWVFTGAGLKRIFERTGWKVLDFSTCGSARSTPGSMENTQRAFCLVKSMV
jgi:tRNA (mo5U34)-methyltransferase